MLYLPSSAVTGRHSAMVSPPQNCSKMLCLMRNLVPGRPQLQGRFHEAAAGFYQAAVVHGREQGVHFAQLGVGFGGEGHAGILERQGAGPEWWERATY